MILEAFMWALVGVLKGMAFFFPDAGEMDLPEVVPLVVQGLNTFIDMETFGVIMSLFLMFVSLWGLVILANKIINLIRGSG
jgi:hypothetical protein